MQDDMTIGGANVFIEDDVTVVRQLFETQGQGAVCVLYDAGLKDEADRVTAELKKVYRVFCYPVASARDGEQYQKASPPEYVRHIIGVGTGSAAQACKRLARDMDVEWSLLFTAPTTDEILCGKSPKNVFISQNMMMNCPFECLAAGYGILFSESLRAFEALFKDKVLALGKQDVAPVSEAKDAVELAIKLLEISSRKQGMDSAELIARLMFFIAKKAGKRPRLVGEYKFLASSLLGEFYSAYLGSPSIDCMPPSCLDGALDVLEYLGAKDIILPKKVDFFDTNAYFRISYILSEYRMDLLDRLGGLDPHTRQRFWRRLYPDAGYWLKSEVTSDELMHAMSLAGAFSDSLLGFAFASGMTERFGAG